MGQGECSQGASDVVEQALQEFFRALRRSKGDPTLLRAASARLYAATAHLGPFDDASEEKWEWLALELRGQDRRVAFLRGTIAQELQRLGITVE
jgi:hypothetical protein